MEWTLRMNLFQIVLGILKIKYHTNTGCVDTWEIKNI